MADPLLPCCCELLFQPLEALCVWWWGNLKPEIVNFDLRLSPLYMLDMETTWKEKY